MSSALTSPAGSGSSPQLQIDLVGLSSLMMSIGSRGLKQLASSGVAVHSLGCMLMIAEFAPASIEFRMTLNRVREQQRSERAWFFKTVEIGSGSNFLADQLLQTRAGTNVVALLTSIASVMNEDSCSRILSLLFEISGVALDNTPGIGEFGKIREALLPVSHRTEFKKKVFQYQELLNTFMLDKIPTGHENPYKTIPYDMDLAKIIQMLFKVSSHEGYILTYAGTVGAGWLATYSSYVLGLATCAIRDSGHVLPINGSYERAKVIIRSSPQNVSSMCEISKAGKIEDFISLTTVGDWQSSGWSIDCTVVNFLDTHQPDLRKETIFPIICEAARLEMIQITTELAREFISKDFLITKNLPISTYTLSVLPHLHSRGSRNLEILGFDFNNLSNISFASKRHSDPTCIICAVNDMQPSLEPHSTNKNGDGTNVDYGMSSRIEFPVDYALVTGSLYSADAKWSKQSSSTTEGKISRLMNYLTCCSNHLQGKGRDHNSQTLAFSDWSEARQEEICRTAIYAANIAARLAFTDWDTSIRCLSVQVFRHPHLYARGKTFHSEKAGFNGHLASAILLCTDTVNVSALKMRITDDWAAIDLDSIIIIRSTVAHRSLSDLRGCYFEFRRGHIFYETIMCTVIRVDRGESYVNGPFSFRYKYNMERPDVVNYSTTWGPRLNPGSIQSRDQIEFRESWKIFKETLTLKLECLVETNRWTSVDPIKISQAIPKLWVTKPCPHPFKNPLRIHGMRNAGPILPPLNIREWVSIFASDPQPRSGRIADYGGSEHEIYYTHTDQNTESRWFSCMVDLDNSIAMILQQDTCLACTIHQIHKMCGCIKNDRFYIIAGDCFETGSSDESETENVLWTCQYYQALSRLEQMRNKSFKKFSLKHDSCPGPVHTECCNRRDPDPCIICVPPICLPETPRACEGCRETCSTWTKLFGELPVRFEGLGN